MVNGNKVAIGENLEDGRTPSYLNFRQPFQFFWPLKALWKSTKRGVRKKSCRRGSNFHSAEVNLQTMNMRFSQIPDNEWISVIITVFKQFTRREVSKSTINFKFKDRFAELLFSFSHFFIRYFNTEIFFFLCQLIVIFSRQKVTSEITVHRQRSEESKKFGQLKEYL